MVVPFSSHQGTLVVEAEALSFALLLERGIDYIRQDSSVEAAAFFTLARERLSPDQLPVAVILDAFLQSHASYWQAQQALHQASKRFVEADVERCTRLQALENLLLSLSEKTQGTVPSLGQLSSPGPQPYKASENLPDLFITCFGHFAVRRSGQPIDLCSNRNGQAILRYLVAQEDRRASVDTLMDILWRQDTPDVARRKLQVAVSAVRCSLNSGYSCGPGEGYILCKDGFYQFNPAIVISTDVDEFLTLWQAGRPTNGGEALTLFEQACNLYSGPFLVEDTYTDWSFIQREHLKDIYCAMCRVLANSYQKMQSYEDAVKWANALLREDRCDEAAHRQLMGIYMALGRRSEALQQYYRCERILSKELGVTPMPETLSVLHAIQSSIDLFSFQKSFTGGNGNRAEIEQK